MLADLAPGVEVDIEIQGNLCPGVLKGPLREVLDLLNPRPALKGLHACEGLPDGGLNLVEFAHDLRVLAPERFIKQTLDVTSRMCFSSIKQALHGVAHSYQAKPDELTRERATNENGLAAATPTPQTASPHHQAL